MKTIGVITLLDEVTMRKSIEKILSNQCAKIEFKNNKVEYFALSTQHGKANTLKEAINNIIKADKKYKGQTPLSYMIEEDIKEVYGNTSLLKMPMPKDLEISFDNLKRSFEEWQKEYGDLWSDILNGKQ